VTRKRASLALVAPLVLAAAPARANGRFPAANQIVFSPTSPGTVVGRTTFGLLPSVDDGATWRWVCEDVLALPPSMVSDPELALTAGGGLVAATPPPFALGISTSMDLGCNWSCATAIGASAVADIVAVPSSPHSVLAILTGSTAADGGFHGPQVYETVDDGTTWAPLGVPIDASDPTLAVHSIDVASSDASRIYVTATRGAGTSRTGSLFVSKDAGATWTEQRLAAYDPSSEGPLYVGAVDPTDADRVYVRTAGIYATTISANMSCDPTYGVSRLFVTTDAGATFQQVTLPVTCQILGFALSPDGSRVYAGTFGDGLFAASRSDMAFHKTSSIHVECLATRGDELWACSDEASGFIFGSSTSEGECFEPRLPQLNDIAGPIACSANAGGPRACMAPQNGSICTNAAFQSLCDNPLSMPSGCFVEAGAIDAGCGDGGLVTADGGRAAGKDSGSCGCRAVGGGGPASVAVVVALGTVGAALRRRRRR
jgi:MYXO-CTERM domain-containing protein